MIMIREGYANDMLMIWSCYDNYMVVICQWYEDDVMMIRWLIMMPWWFVPPILTAIQWTCQPTVCLLQWTAVVTPTPRWTEENPSHSCDSVIEGAVVMAINLGSTTSQSFNIPKKCGSLLDLCNKIAERFSEAKNAWEQGYDLDWFV